MTLLSCFNPASPDSSISFYKEGMLTSLTKLLPVHPQLSQFPMSSSRFSLVTLIPIYFSLLWIRTRLIGLTIPRLHIQAHCPPPAHTRSKSKAFSCLRSWGRWLPLLAFLFRHFLSLTTMFSERFPLTTKPEEMLPDIPSQGNIDFSLPNMISPTTQWISCVFFSICVLLSKF